MRAYECVDVTRERHIVNAVEVICDDEAKKRNAELRTNGEDFRWVPATKGDPTP